MKKLLFSFVMMIALVIVAGSAMAQVAGDKFMPYAGGIYTYSLPIKINSVGSAVITFSDPTMMAFDGTTTPTSFASIPASTTLLSFNVKYDAGITPGDKTIKLVLTAGGCSNNITLTVKVQAKPTIALAITGTDAACQALNPSPADNVAATVSSTTYPLDNNTFTYLVVPTITPTSGRNYDFHFVLNDYSFGSTVLSISQSGGASMTGNNTTGYDIKGATGNVTITATFKTTPGVAAKTFTGTASVVTLHVDAAGNVTYAGSDANANAKISEMPDITGGFN